MSIASFSIVIVAIVAMIVFTVAAVVAVIRDAKRERAARKRNVQRAFHRSYFK